MKKIYTLIFLLYSFSASSQVVINEVYGGGGNAGSTYKNDFIELYNNGSSAVSLAGWSVQYASSTGTTWAVTNLTGSIPAKGYYLIQQAAGTGGTTNLPTPDATGSIAMSGTNGKVILCNVTTAQTGADPVGTQIIDKVGYGTGTNGFEGTGPTATLTNTTSAQRTPIGFDSNNNSSDFTTGTPSPTNAGGGADTTPPTISALSPANGA
ncbi:MAG: lamin tail domain-containing protein, partial [Chitinophagaceae bacterium]|nr:lamin tail domain-containing protein [Chitinophagaceae bacterium]